MPIYPLSSTLALFLHTQTLSIPPHPQSDKLEMFSFVLLRISMITSKVVPMFISHLYFYHELSLSIFLLRYLFFL